MRSVYDSSNPGDLTASAKRYEADRKERGKYLAYKSLSGVDTVPRIREPTPPNAVPPVAVP